jgi:hypothetical protein
MLRVNKSSATSSFRLSPRPLYPTSSARCFLLRALELGIVEDHWARELADSLTRPANDRVLRHRLDSIRLDWAPSFFQTPVDVKHCRYKEVFCCQRTIITR